MERFTYTRRRLLNGAGALVVLGAAGSAAYFAADHRWPVADPEPEGSADLTAAEIKSICALCDAIIPATNSGGALAAGVVAYISGLFAGETESGRGDFRSGLASLTNDVARRQHDDDLAGALGAILRESDRNDPSSSVRFLRRLKRSVLVGYYTSELGASVELVYAPVPGVYQPDVRVGPATRAFSNDTGALF